MKKLVIFMAIVFATKMAFAQNCNETALEEVPGTWKPGDKGAIYLTNNDLAKAKSITTSIDKMMRSEFQVPNGLVATYFTAFMGYDTYNGNGLAQYDYTNWFNHFMCYNNKVTKNPDSKLIIRISFNNPNIQFSRDVLPGEWEESEKDRYGWLDNFPDQKDGIIFMKSTPDAGQFTYKPDRWLLTYDGKLPYTYVTRFEYLQKLKEKFAKSFQKNIKDIQENYPVRSKEAQEKEKQEALQKFKEEAAQGYGDWTDRYLQNYRTDEQKQEEFINVANNEFKQRLQVVEGLLTMTDKELQKTAIVSTLGDFSGFSNEGDVGAKIIVKNNPDYYNDKLGKAVPQIIFVSLTRYGNQEQQKYITAYDGIVKRLDFDKLKALLGK